MFVVVQIIREDAVGRVEEGWRRTPHGTAEHADRVGDVRARLRETVKQGADQGLIGAQQFGCRRVILLCRDGGVDELG
eukprot:5101330-Pleurochrysis_carterae.AAC.1